MPFVAVNSEGERIDITSMDNPRKTLKPYDLFCPQCKGKMFIRGSKNIQYHFYHKANCTSKYKSHAESPDHLRFKRKVAEHLKNEVQEYSNAKIEYEYPIMEIMRIADVMMIFPNGWLVAHEIQLSYISEQDLQERTEDYLDAGIDVIWWLGKRANNETNRNWCRENIGICYTLCVPK